MPITNLKNKNVLITGAASGIGRATALAFANRGATLLLCDIDSAGLESLHQQVVNIGAKCSTYAVDVTDANAMAELAAQVHFAHGALDVLVNNAGVGYLGRFLDSNLKHWERVLDINLMGVVHGCYYFIPRMIQAHGPRQVINVASAAALFPSPSMAAYAASKHAVYGLSEVLKMELSDTEVQVTTVCPGIINTPIVANHNNISPSVELEQLKRLQHYYQSKGCSPDLVAESIVRAVGGKRDLILVGPFARLIFQLRRISVGLLRRIVLNDARKIGYL
ncbi:SDR family NAD(P)-dependent oxidoreductase [Pseudomonas resinovorans]|uniref:SDR family NAD(P)-dependent oxidoreductase n=1 Tax=Metapseudomonas resinovorans TaxID=53412 RepID=A0ABT4YDQ1_METRE|nr:SDR family NAD(P)-dependent oxidoreductase [Pseudomonas resinovorans]MDA8486655.1 SDR family NAD(P)-dependent oxidoreductase [Pseudomonas resinovorans]